MTPALEQRARLALWRRLRKLREEEGVYSPEEELTFIKWRDEGRKIIKSLGSRNVRG